MAGTPMTSTLRLGKPHGQRAWLDRPAQVIGEHR